MICPGCGGVLVSVRRDDWTLHACNGCGGVWAHATTAKRAFGGLARAVADDVIDAGRDATRTTQDMTAEGPSTRLCPSCRAPLVTSKRSGLYVDACERHGTWFDRGELERLAPKRGKQQQKQRKPPASTAPPPAKTSGESVGDVALGAIEILGALLQALG